jgi:hypothetical protein
MEALDDRPRRRFGQKSIPAVADKEPEPTRESGRPEFAGRLRFLKKEAAMEDSEAGVGWVVFAGIMISIAGVWIVLVIGVLQLFAAFSIWQGGEYGRWIGLISASVSAIASLMSIGAYPFWALCLFGVDLLIIYGLAAYGGRQLAP